MRFQRTSSLFDPDIPSPHSPLPQGGEGSGELNLQPSPPLVERRVMKQQSLSQASEPNQLYCGDCLSILDAVPDACVDLIYIDPPFYSQRSYEMIWGEDAAERFAFADRWAGGINHYVNYLSARIKKMR